MAKKIAVIGGGATGHAVAAIMTMRGFEVRFHDDERFAANFDAIREFGFIELRGGIHGTAMPAVITTDPAEAVTGADLIFVHVPADRHEEIARRIAPYVQDGQHILIIPGNLGSFIFRKVFQEMGVKADVTLSEKEGNFCPCRLSEPAEVTVGNKLNLKGKISALPASDTPRVLEALEGVVEYTANKNVFEAAIRTGNVVSHIASTILSAAEVERKGNKYSLFKYAFTPATLRCQEKIVAERAAVIEAMGFTAPGDPMAMFKRIQEIEKHPEIHMFYEYMDGPSALDHRYLHEDCGCGGAFAVSMAKHLGLEMPTLEAFLGVAGAINDRDYIHGGRTLENLGFSSDMTLEEIYAAI